MACVVVGTDEFLPLARAQSAARGLPELPVITVRHPIGGISPGAAKAEPVVLSVLRALTSPPSAEATTTGAGLDGIHGAPSDLDEFQGWLNGAGMERWPARYSSHAGAREADARPDATQAR